MMPQNVARRIGAEFQSLSKGMQRVGTYVLNHPEDVALLSMREVARRISVTPATITRLVQRLGYAGYDEFRELFADSLRERVSDFSDRAGRLAARRKELGEAPLAQSLANAFGECVAELADTARLPAILLAAETIGKARRILCLGHRSCYAPAYHFAYVAGLHGAPTHLLDAPGGIGADSLNDISDGDVVVAVSFAPYTRMTVDVAAVAKERGADLIALTDKLESPLARIATQIITVPTDIAGATYVTAPVLAVAELLAALVVAKSGAKGRAILERNEAGLARRHIYWTEQAGAVA